MKKEGKIIQRKERSNPFLTLLMLRQSKTDREAKRFIFRLREETTHRQGGINRTPEKPFNNVEKTLSNVF